MFFLKIKENKRGKDIPQFLKDFVLCYIFYTVIFFGARFASIWYFDIFIEFRICECVEIFFMLNIERHVFRTHI